MAAAPAAASAERLRNTFRLNRRFDAPAIMLTELNQLHLENWADIQRTPKGKSKAGGLRADSNVYRYAINAPTTGSDPIGEQPPPGQLKNAPFILTQKNIEGPKDENCGKTTVKMQFSISRPTVFGGYVIQEAAFVIFVFDAHNKPVGPPRKDHYWEAFDILTFGNTTDTDTWRVPDSGVGTWGLFGSGGSAYYYDKLTATDIAAGGFAVHPGWPSGNAPASRTPPPANWERTSGALVRTLFGGWSCLSKVAKTHSGYWQIAF